MPDSVDRPAPLSTTTPPAPIRPAISPTESAGPSPSPAAVQNDPSVSLAAWVTLLCCLTLADALLVRGATPRTPPPFAGSGRTLCWPGGATPRTPRGHSPARRERACGAPPLAGESAVAKAGATGHPCRGWGRPTRTPP